MLFLQFTFIFQKKEEIVDTKLEELRKDTKKAEEFFIKMMAYTLGPVELKEMIKNNHAKILDVRDYSDYTQGHIPNAVSMPRHEMEDRINELSKEDLSIVYCYNQQCHLGLCACRFLASNGYPCMHLEGGYKVWSEDFQFATTHE